MEVRTNITVHGIDYADGIALREALPHCVVDFGSFFVVSIGGKSKQDCKLFVDIPLRQRKPSEQKKYDDYIAGLNKDQ